MTDQERLDAIDDYKDRTINLTAGLQENGRPEPEPEDEILEDLSTNGAD